MKFFAIFGLSLFLLGCAGVPTKSEIASADYGQNVAKEECIRIAKRFITSKMRDPTSVLFDGVKCQKGWRGDVPLAGVSTTFGYHFAGNVNGKNGFGGYAGATPFAGIVRDDGEGARVVRYCMVRSTDEYGLCVPSMTR